MVLIYLLRKDNTGYDLKSLFLGAEATLGIITAAVVKLYPLPTEHQTAWLAVNSIGDVCHLLALSRRLSGDTVTSFEYISRQSLQLAQARVEGLHMPFVEPHAHQVLLELSGPKPWLRALSQTGYWPIPPERGSNFGAFVRPCPRRKNRLADRSNTMSQWPLVASPNTWQKSHRNSRRSVRIAPRSTVTSVMATCTTTFWRPSTKTPRYFGRSTQQQSAMPCVR